MNTREQNNFMSKKYLQNWWVLMSVFTLFSWTCYVHSFLNCTFCENEWTCSRKNFKIRFIWWIFDNSGCKCCIILLLPTLNLIISILFTNPYTPYTIPENHDNLFSILDNWIFSIFITFKRLLITTNLISKRCHTIV